MHLSCSAPALRQALKAGEHLHASTHQHQVLLAATPATEGRLYVLGWNARQTLGLLASLPAQVTEAGRVCVTASHLAGYLALQSARSVHLLREEPPTEADQAPLQLMCQWTSEHGTQASRQARFLAGSPGALPPFSVVEWRERAQWTGRLSARALRAALASCASLINAMQQDTPHLGGLLLRMEPGMLQFTVSTRRDLLSQRLAFSGAGALCEPCHIWFEGTDLTDLGAMLQEEERVTLRLLCEEECALVLVESETLALCCRGRTTDLPLFLEQAPLFPALGRLRVSRDAFTQAINRLERATRDREDTALVSLRQQGQQMCLELVPASQEDLQMQSTLDMHMATAPLPPLLIDLPRLATLLRVPSGTELVLEWGTLSQGQDRLVGFLRLLDEAAGLTLVLARADLPQSDAASTLEPFTDKESNTMSIPESDKTSLLPGSSSTPYQEEEALTASTTAIPAFQEDAPSLPAAPQPANQPLASEAMFVRSLYRESASLVGTLPAQLARAHVDEALPQLALFYHRQLLQVTRTRAEREACAWIRDHLLRAPSVQEAWEQMQARGQREDGALALQAAELLQQIREADGALEPLIVGVTDGFHHCCVRCGQDAEARASLRFFCERDRRWLLAPEIGPTPRSVYERCQCCLQPLAPTALVVLVPGGTGKHAQGCACGQCDQRGLCWLLNLYACDQVSQQILLPPLAQIQAPSRQQALELAVARCWREGWYLLGEDPRVYAHAPLALAPVEDQQPVL